MKRVTSALLLAALASLTAHAAPLAAAPPSTAIAGRSAIDHERSPLRAPGADGLNYTSSKTPAPKPPPPPPPPPPASGHLAATPGNGQVALAWDAVPGATRYSVYRAVNGAWDAAALAMLTGTTFRNGGLTNGTAYSYRVAAANTGGAGPFSPVATATPFTAPTDVTAAAGDTKVTVRWTAAPGADTYTVFRGTSSSIGTMTPVASGLTAPMFADSGLTNGTTYYYRVRSQAGSIVSAPSHVASAKPLPPPPSTAPQNLIATPGNMLVTLAWSPVDGGVGYKIYRSTGGAPDATLIASVSGPKFKDSGLTNGTTYWYRVGAYNKGGIGPVAAASATPLAPPAPPTGAAAAAGDALVTITWDSVAAAATYNVYRGTAPAREAHTPVAVGLTSRTLVDRQLQNGLTYYYQVTAVNGGGESPQSDEVNASPEAPPLVPDQATIDAFQLLRQTTWGPRPGDVDALKLQGTDAFLAAQLSAPPSTFPSSLFNQPIEAAQERFMANALTGPDQLRQRVAWALHKIWVVSAVEVPSTTAIITYYRLLTNGAFGNYRDLMHDMTLNPAMGQYLNMLNSRSQAVSGTPPNENYAREVMQLFTLGIPTLRPDGTPVVDAGGAPVPSYTEHDVKELARILTGWTFGDGNPAAPKRAGRENFAVPMEPVAAFHDTGAKTFLGHDFLAGQSAQQDLDQALDVLFNHPNLAPFVSRQLIQQLVTSNPSPAYVTAVAAVFSGSGGARGDLAAVVRAILTNPEARASTATSGKLAEPVLFVASTLRALGATVTDHPFMSDKAEAMGQKVFYPPSVFSYFSPGYRVRGTNGGHGVPLGGPEFQILTTVTALERANFIGDLLGGHFGGDVAVDYAPFTSRAGDAGVLVDYCNLLVTGGRMSPAERTEIVNAVRTTPLQNRSERARTALYLTLAAAQAQVDR